MKLFVDDEREPLEQGWTIARNAIAAIGYIANHAVASFRNTDPQDLIEAISFDHDIGVTGSGYEVACYLEEKVLQGLCQAPRLLRVHSGNSRGVDDIMMSLQAIVRYCEREGMDIPVIQRVQTLDVCKPMS